MSRASDSFRSLERVVGTEPPFVDHTRLSMGWTEPIAAAINRRAFSKILDVIPVLGRTLRTVRDAVVAETPCPSGDLMAMVGAKDTIAT